jgi:DNA-binding MarR family transcriptional regulator
MPQFRALDLLVKSPLRMSEIAAALGTSLQATTSLIDRLVDKGLVERGHDAADRRVVICHLTPAGQSEMNRFFRMGQARLELLIDLLTDEELDTVISAFVTLGEAALRRQQAAATAGSTPERPHEKEQQIS